MIRPNEPACPGAVAAGGEVERQAPGEDVSKDRRPPDVMGIHPRQCEEVLAGPDEPGTGPAVDRVAEGCVALPRRPRVGVVPLSGRNCWPQGQLQEG